MTILTYIQELLETENQPSSLRESSDHCPYERILVPCRQDNDQPVNILEITAHPQFFEGAFTKEKVNDFYHLLQFQFVMPVEVSPKNLNQVSACLHFFNHLLHCPGFELDTLNNRIVYRYVWFIKRKGIDSFLLMQVLGNIQSCFKMFSPYIQDIAQGQYKLEDILESVQKLTQQKSS